MNVLLSIKPRFVEEILNGTKRYEFRKTVFKSSGSLEKIYIYSSAPVKRIVASFMVDTIIEDHPKELWQKLRDFSGVTETDFFNYFGFRDRGYAIKIKDLQIFAKPLNPKDIRKDFLPPQSFCYTEDNFEEFIQDASS